MVLDRASVRQAEEVDERHRDARLGLPSSKTSKESDNKTFSGAGRVVVPDVADRAGPVEVCKRRELAGTDAQVGRALATAVRGATNAPAPVGCFQKVTARLWIDGSMKAGFSRLIE